MQCSGGVGAQISHLAIDFLPSMAAILQLQDDHGDDNNEKVNNDYANKI